jgi:hypothetical protein
MGRSYTSTLYERTREGMRRGVCAKQEAQAVMTASISELRNLCNSAFDRQMRWLPGKNLFDAFLFAAGFFPVLALRIVGSRLRVVRLSAVVCRSSAIG